MTMPSVRSLPYVETAAPPTSRLLSRAYRRERRLRDNALQEAVAKTLQRARVAASDMQELTHETMKRALAYADLPDDDEECRQYVCGIARNLARTLRKQRARGRSHVSLQEAAADLPRTSPQLEDRLVVERALDLVPPTERQACWWFIRHAFGESYAEIAGEEGLQYNAVYYAGERARQKLERAIYQGGIFVFVMVFLWAALRDVRPRQDVADPNKLPKTEELAPTTTPKPEGVKTSPAPAVTDANEIRREALAACDAGEWIRCYRGLDEAKAIDPAGDEAPAVVRARQAAVDAMQSKSSAKSPRVPRAADAPGRGSPNAPR